MARKHKLSFLLPFLASVFLTTFPQSFTAFAQDTTQSFTGSWTANGTRETLAFGEERDTALIKLSGHVNLQDELGKEKDYWSTCIGLVDTQTGSDVRCVWKGLKGTEIFIVLQADEIAEKSKVTGEVVGGTGAVKGVQGTLKFTWSSLTFQTTNKIKEMGGFTTDIQGTYTLP